MKSKVAIFNDKYSKLFESIAMLLILLSWGLEWNGIKNLEQKTNSLHASLESIQEVYISSDISSTIKLEAAVTRYITKIPTDNVIRFLGDYAKSWQSPDVRHEWFKRFSNEMNTIQARLTVLKSINKSHSPKLKNVILDIEAKIVDIQKELFNKLDIQALDGKVFFKPEISQMSGREAGMLDEKLKPINSELLRLINITIKNMHDKQIVYSEIFRLLFIIGSIMLILTKLFDWIISFKKDSSNSQMDFQI